MAGNRKYDFGSNGIESLDQVGGMFIRQPVGAEATPTYAFNIDGTAAAANSGMWLTPATSDLHFSTAGSTRVTISGSGKVGIGTTTPSEALTVVAAVGTPIAIITPSATNGIAGISFSNYSADPATNRKGAIIFERNGADGSIRGRMHLCLDAASGAGNAEVADAVMTLSSSGNVGIGTVTPAYKLDVVGTGRFTSIIETSERELKEDITSQTSQLDNIMKLNPIDFSWRDNNKKSKGFIADEVEKVYPELVAKDEEGKASGIEYSKMVSVLTQGIKELNEIVSKQQETIEELRKKIEDKN
jgi:hypothetical protein